MTYPRVINLEALYRGDYDAELAAASSVFADPLPGGLLMPTAGIPIRIPGRNIMKVRQLIDVLDDSRLQVGDAELYLEIDVESSTRAVARLVAGNHHPADHEVVDVTDTITLLEHTSVTGQVVADSLEPNGAPAINEPSTADFFGILLQYPEGPRVVFRFPSREEAQKHLDATLATMPADRDRIDPRWLTARVVEVPA